jgi:DNA repair protein RadC
MGEQVEVPYLKIQDWAKADRPRERLIQRGNTVLTNAELLGILIGSGTNKMSAVNLAQLILKYYDNDLNLLAKCSVKELQRFKGIGEAKAVAIVSAMELGRRRTDHSIPPRPRFYDSGSVYHFIKSELLDKPIEEFWIILSTEPTI